MTNDPRRTEQINSAYPNLDLLEPLELVHALVDDQERALEAVQQAAFAIAKAVKVASSKLEQGGRLIYIGAGTSGRLGVLDATELTPTFSWPASRAIPIIAGGEKAIRQAVEGAEDDINAGKTDFLATQPQQNDVLIAIAASGTTPYVLGAIAAAKALGVISIGIANNPNTPILEISDIAILLDTGPEVISGSTRLKAGTAQKIALNTLSSAIMVKLGKVYGNLMVDVKATNKKLEARAIRLVKYATKTDQEVAEKSLIQADWSVKTAIVMLKFNLSAQEAQNILEANQGKIRIIEHL